MLISKTNRTTESRKLVRQKKVFISQDRSQKLSRTSNNQQKTAKLLTSKSPDRINSLQNQLIIKYRTPKNTASCSFVPITTRPNLMEFDARVARGDDEAATETRVFDAVQCALLSPPRNPNEHAAAWPGEHSNAVGVLWLGEAEGGGDFSLARVEDQAGDLRVAVDCCKLDPGESVEEVDASVIASASCGDERGLPGREGNGLASSVQSAWRDGEDFALAGQTGFGRAIVDVDNWRVSMGVWRARPQDSFRLEEEEDVVVTARGEELAVRTPSNAAYLLGVTADPRQQCHAAVPVKEVPLVLIRPFD
jgi:hypothetical protein